MLIAVGFDGVIAQESLPPASSLAFLPGAEEGLQALARAGHVLVVWSMRASVALREDWRRNPLWRLGLVPFDRAAWEQNSSLHQQRYQDMLDFLVDTRLLPGVVRAVDDGCGGKPLVDLFIDNKAVHLGGPGGARGWKNIATQYGEPQK